MAAFLESPRWTTEEIKAVINIWDNEEDTVPQIHIRTGGLQNNSGGSTQLTSWVFPGLHCIATEIYQPIT
ncbi:hypothetical protein TNCT_248281 [Trichonephila clavata]|uniref:Uncharacterized protein n=1 Tax=Trichonephila clavata TaxID=2740835 RepID=A0A8X6HA26_TRICU|nr:hypothetical protein TNCT_248281 [Trichonephila clavata]